MVLWFQKWMTEGHVAPLTAIRRKAGLGTRLSQATSQHHVFHELLFAKSFLDIISIGPFTIEVLRGSPCRDVYLVSNWN